MKITLNEIVGQHVTEIKTASELFLVQALAYCIQNMLPENELCVDNIRINENLAHCPYLRQNERYNLKYSNQTARFTAPYSVLPQTAIQHAGVLERFNAYMTVFTACETAAPTSLFEYVFFKHNEESNEIHISSTDIAGIYGTTSLENNPQAYVYALALLLLISYIKNTEFNVVLHTDNTRQVYEYSHVYTLMLMGNKLLQRLHIRIDDDYTALCKQRWAATVFERRCRGLMVPEYVYKYTEQDKVNTLLCNDIRVGDVILTYTSLQESETTDVASMFFNSCEAGVILDITDRGISVQYLETLATKIGVIRTIEAGISAGNTLYRITDKNKCLKPVKYIAFDECGIEGCTNNANTVIMRIPEGVEDEESSNYYQWLDYSIVQGKDARKVKLDIFDTIYTTFMDRQIAFDTVRFKNAYFKNRVPEYDIRVGRLEQMLAIGDERSVYSEDMYRADAKAWTPADSIEIEEDATSSKTTRKLSIKRKRT